MNKVITINLGGNAYQLEEAGYDQLRKYLDAAASQLEKNPDRDEILSDIERAIAEKFRALLGRDKTVVLTNEAAGVITEMGPIEADPAGSSEPAGGAGKPAAEEQKTNPGSAPKRLYRIPEGAMIAGVCNGIAAYFNLDPTLVRLGFAILTLFWGTGIAVYVIMAFVVPEATSPEQKAAATGAPFTAQEFISRAKEGYYSAMKGFPDRYARREWYRQFKRDIRAHARQWRWNWHGHWGSPGQYSPGMAFTLPFFSLLHGVATIVLVCALVSLLNTHSLFGLALPATMPVWLAAALMFFAYALLSAPLKLARRACYRYPSDNKWAGPVMILMDVIIWLAVAAAVVWLTLHYMPEIRHAVESAPAAVHQAADDIRDWWHTN